MRSWDPHLQVVPTQERGGGEENKEEGRTAERRKGRSGVKTRPRKCKDAGQLEEWAPRGGIAAKRRRTGGRTGR